ncbi:phospho-N-acetylmuramoyl-pentapeptide-transferase [uncultured Ruminococcus sp.]|uniref:phospho-N-acetylmuramoyl-pentapeptide- transferase n=1 Tax=uncultured Ruminococcus sp. TaxID=165186 RepID=UPI0025DF780D|nr:phospho-N-acetylmuramoyl-pentapeptide-transferase [uncultured Ruminococcus sp.]
MVYKWLCERELSEKYSDFANGSYVLGLSKSYALFLLLMIFCSFALTFLVLKHLKGILPKDQGRQFAVNGALSEGKPRGCGLLFMTTFTLCAALFIPLEIESVIYLACIYGAMLTGYFDDAAEKPWGNVKKGLCDLVISLAVAFTYYHYNGSDIRILLFGVESVHIPAALFIILAGVLVWTAINVTNCSDGVDGLCSSLVMAVLAVMLLMTGFAKSVFGAMSPYIMFATLAAYLWFNCSPSKMLMGDAGSRALGVFLAILFLNSAAPLSFIPMCIVIIIDGGLGLLKLSFRRFLGMKKFMDNIRTPIHDHERKNKGWSDTQVVTRFTIIQLVVNLCYMAAVSWIV